MVDNLDYWFHEDDYNSSAPCAYSYIRFSYAGTENILTYIIFLDMPRALEWNNSNMTQQITVRHNKSVIYNVYNGGTLNFYSDNNRIRLNSVVNKIAVSPSTPGACLYFRNHAYYKAGSYLANIPKAILGFAPDQVSGVVSLWETLTKNNETKTGNEYLYYSIPEDQINYDGRLLREISSDDVTLQKEGDYIYLNTRGTGTTIINWSYSYNCDYK